MLAKVRIPSSPVRERERESVRKRERERDVELSRIVIFILKGMMAALAPSSYLVYIRLTLRKFFEVTNNVAYCIAAP